MPDEKPEPYAIEPEENRPAPAGKGDQPRPQERKARIDEPGLLSEFPEDADFDTDPELERAIAGPKRAPESPAKAEPAETLVKPGYGSAQTWAIIGAVLLVGAMIATAVNAPSQPVLRLMLTLYNTLLHSGTGVVALFATAMLTERRLGVFEQAAARMFTAVAAFMLIFNLNINFIGEGWERWKVEELVFATAVYVLAVASTFGLWKGRMILYVLGSHFFLWLVVYVGMLLSAYVAAGGRAA